MKVGWILRLEDEKQNTVCGVVRMSKRDAEQKCSELVEKNQTKAEIISIYTEYDVKHREIKQYQNVDLKEILKVLSDLNPLVLSQQEGQVTIEIDKVTSVC